MLGEAKVCLMRRESEFHRIRKFAQRHSGRPSRGPCIAVTILKVASADAIKGWVEDCSYIHLHNRRDSLDPFVSHHTQCH